MRTGQHTRRQEFFVTATKGKEEKVLHNFRQLWLYFCAQNA